MTRQWIKTLALGLVVAFGLSIPASSQNTGTVPNHAIPIGKGPGVQGFGSAAPGAVGTVVTSNGASTDPSFQTIGASSFGAQSANWVLAGPTTGAAATPTFRALVGADLPNPSASTLGGVQSKAAVSNQFLTSVSTSGVPASAQPAFTNLSGQATLAQLPSLATNTVLSNATSGTAVPTALAVPSCSTSTSALKWTTNTGFGCNTISGSVGTATPEDYGAVGNGSTDDTAAFQSLCTAIRAGTVNNVQHTYGKTYKVLPVGTTTGTILCNLTNVDGLRWNFNGSPLTATYTDVNVQTYIFYGPGLKHADFIGIKGTSPVGGVFTGGVDWVGLQDDAQNNRVIGINVDGGRQGVYCQRVPLQNTLIGYNLEVTGRFKNVTYPMSNQFNCYNTRIDIQTENAQRDLVAYNIAGINARIVSKNPQSQMSIGVYGTVGDLSANKTSDIHINYINKYSTSFGAPTTLLAHNQYGNTGNVANIPTTFENIYLDYDIDFGSATNTTLYGENSFVGNGLSTNVRSTATLGGTITTGDTLTLIATGGTITGSPVSVAYVTVAGDTLTTAAAGLVKAMNLTANTSNAGIFASSSGAVVSLWSPPALTVAWTKTVGGAATETITIAAAGTTSGNVMGDPGNTNRNIVIRGRVPGMAALTNIAGIMSTLEPATLTPSGYNGSSTGTYSLKDLSIPNATGVITVGSGAKVIFENVNAPSVPLPTFEGTPSRRDQLFIGSVFSNAGDAANVAQRATSTLRIVDPFHAGTVYDGITIEGNGQLSFTDTLATSGYIYGDSGNLYITTGAANDLNFRPAGTSSWLMKATGGHIVPVTNNTFDLGATATRMRKVWTTDLDFSGTLTGTVSTATTATNATNTAITDDTTTNATMYPTWVTAATGNLPQKVSSTKMTFNPSTGLLTSTAYTGSLAGSTGLPISTGVSGLGTNVATFLATPSSANEAAALTDETGSGPDVFATSPTMTGVSTDTLASTSTTDATTTTAAPLKAAGGLAIAKKSFFGDEMTITANATALPAASAGSLLHLGNANSANTRVTLDSFAALPVFNFRRADGTAASPTAIQNTEIFGAFGAAGYGATGYGAGTAGIFFVATQNWTDSANGNAITFNTTANGSATQTEVAKLDGKAHLGYTATAPTISSCGTSPSTARGTDTAGEVTTGTTTTGCTITFANSGYTAAPYCVVGSQTQLAAFTYALSTTAITITQTSTSSNKINWVCHGN